jgi:hypothetical protein
MHSSAPIDLTGDDDGRPCKTTKIPLKQKTLKKKADLKQKNRGERPISLITNSAATEKKNMRQAFLNNPDYFEDVTFVQNLEDPNTSGCEPRAWFNDNTIDIFLKTTHRMLGNPEVTSFPDSNSRRV